MSPEEQYLGALLLHHDNYWKYPVKGSDFVSPRCRRVYEAIGKVVDSGQVPEWSVLVHELKGIDVTWLASLTSEPVLNVDRVASLVIEGGKRQKLKVLAAEVGEMVDSEPIGTVLDKVEAGLTEITERRERDVVAVRDEVKPMLEIFEKRYHAHGTPGLQSGIPRLDQLTMGFEKAKLYVVGGRPSEGKSALLLNMAVNVARKVPVGFLSIESSRYEMLERWYANESGIEVNKLKTGFISAKDFAVMHEAGNAIFNSPMYIADRPNMDLSDLRSTARYMVRVHHTEILFIDYMQLVQCDGTDYERVSKVSVALKTLARELEVPVVAAAQLNRQAGEVPTLKDLKGSGQIEQDADVAILISHDATAMWLNVEKNRDGDTGRVKAIFDKPKMRIREAV